MPDELTFLNTLVAQLGGQGLVLGIMALYLWRKGILKNLLNGNGHNHGEIDNIKSEIAELRDNHMHELSEKLDKLISKEDEGNLISKEILIILKQKHE